MLWARGGCRTVRRLTSSGGRTSLLPLLNRLLLWREDAHWLLLPLHSGDIGGRCAHCVNDGIGDGQVANVLAELIAGGSRPRKSVLLGVLGGVIYFVPGQKNVEGQFEEDVVSGKGMWALLEGGWGRGRNNEQGMRMWRCWSVTCRHPRSSDTRAEACSCR